MSTQELRPSQFITTYGPGAIIEAPGGPGVMRSLAASRLFARRSVADFEVAEVRLSSLLEGAGLARVPTNAELGQSPLAGVYTATAFPAWSLCVEHNVIYHQAVSRAGCPRCSNQSESKARLEAVRFVRACSQGHLDDVDWPHLMKHRQQGCSPQTLIWEGGGGALRNVLIRCPACGAGVNFGAVYARNLPCSGRFAEDGPERPGCSSDSRVLHRGAANLRIADLASALTIPKSDTRLHHALESQSIRTIIELAPPTSRDDFLAQLTRLAEIGLVRQTQVDEVKRHTWEEVAAAIEDVSSAAVSAGTGGDLRFGELVQLERAAVHGAPPDTRGGDRTAHDFEVRPSDTRTFEVPGLGEIRIAAISRLRVVTAQVGYRRLIDPDPTRNHRVPVSIFEKERDWYPAVPLYGEGVFVEMPNASATAITGTQAAHGWSQAPPSHAELLTELASLDAGGTESSPLFAWWHTLSHALLRALSLDTGYSSAALRERVYACGDDVPGGARGGVLIYTAQPGGDGTLGGLVSSVSRFDEVLDRAIAGLRFCSNDPLCFEEQFEPGKVNGAACYACLLASETSCEIRNMSLDRHLVLESLA